MSNIINILMDGEGKEVDGELIFTLDNFVETPTTDKKIDYLYILMNIQSFILNENKVYFPTRMDKWNVDIRPTEQNINNNLFSLKGIQETITKNKENLLKGKNFFKTQVLYNEGNDIPTIRIHFYKFHPDSKTNVRYESLIYPFTFFRYEKKLFTKKRKKDLKNSGIDFKFLEILPLMNICPINFDEKMNLKPLKELERYTDSWL